MEKCFSCIRCGCLPRQGPLVCQLITAALLLAGALVVYPLFDEAILSMSKTKTLMTKDNYQIWGQIPGESGSIIHRKFYIDQITNPREVVYEGKPAIVQEVGPFIYQELQTYSSPVFNKEMTKIDYNFWLRYQEKDGPLDPRTTMVNTVNLGSMGAWYQLKNARDDQVAIQAFAQLVYGLEAQLYLSAIAQAINFQFLADRNSVMAVLKRNDIEEASLQNRLYSDTLYGWGHWKTLQNWVQAIQNEKKSWQMGEHSNEYLFLKEYFGLDSIQATRLMGDQEVQNMIQTAKQLVDNTYCKGKTCEDKQLLAMQWANCTLTRDTPAGIPQQKSVVFLNDSFIGGGYLEIKYFYEEYFIQNISDDSRYQVSFDEQWVTSLFNHSATADEYFSQGYYMNQMQLLHPGNIKYFFEQSARFQQSKQENDLLELAQRFGLGNDLNRTRVFYEYVIYMVNEFAQKQKTYGGNKAIASLGTVGSQALYQSFQNLTDFLLPRLLSELIYQQVTTNSQSCQLLIYNSIQGMDMNQAQQLCQHNPILMQPNYSSILLINQVCESPFSPAYNQFYQQNNNLLTALQLEQLCDHRSTQGHQSYQKYYQQSQAVLSTHYSCALTKCSRWEIALMQWRGSLVTLNLPSELQSLHVASYSVHSWDPVLFPQVIEYLAVMESFSDMSFINFENEKQRYSQSDAQYLLTFERLFSNVVQSSVFLVPSQSFSSYFLRDNQAELQFYLRYIVLEVALQGAFHSRSAQDLLWGYTDPFVLNLKHLDVQKGGDPSLNAQINLAGFNFTQEQSSEFPQQVYSGKGDHDLTRYYSQLYHRSYTTVQATAFDGKQVSTIYFNPWREQVPIQGSDSFQNPLQDQRIYITDIYRGAPMTNTLKKEDVHGVTTTILEVAPQFFQAGSDFSPNLPFYMDRYQGLLNLTSVKTLPLFMTLPYNYKLGKYQELQHASFLGENGQPMEYQEPRDTIRVHMEPYSGVCLKAAIFLQSHVMVTRDTLFAYAFKGDSLLPVFLLRRVGGFSQEGADEQFGLMGTAFVIRLVLVIVLGLLCGLYCGLAVHSAYLLYQKHKYQGGVPLVGDHLLLKCEL